MASELTLKEQNTVSVIAKHDLGDMIKPLIKEIHLFDSFVAGTSYLEDQIVLESLEVGEDLTLQREENKFDDKAILVLTAEKKKLGYVPRKDNVIFARLMDAGKMLKARISGIEQRGSITQISVGIYLVDF